MCKETRPSHTYLFAKDSFNEELHRKKDCDIIKTAKFGATASLKLYKLCKVLGASNYFVKALILKLRDSKPYVMPTKAKGYGCLYFFKAGYVL